MAVLEKYAVGPIATLMNAELDGVASSTTLAAGAIQAGSYSNNVGGGGGDGYPLCELEFALGGSFAPTLGSGVYVWFLRQPDGTNYEDGGAAIIPARPPNAVILFRNAAAPQRATISGIVLPPGNIKALISHNLGTTLATGGVNTLKILPYTRQGV